MKRSIIVLFALVLSFKVFCQVNQGPPPEVAAPMKENIVLIDQLMEVSGYGNFFREYCNLKIDDAAISKKWKQETIDKRKLEVSFDEFKRHTIYNAFSFIPEKQLKQLIILSTDLAKQKPNTFFITNTMIQSNLESFVKRYLRTEQ
jgi:hypothetical protein